jgi:hypothetical protein
MGKLYFYKNEITGGIECCWALYGMKGREVFSPLIGVQMLEFQSISSACV